MTSHISGTLTIGFGNSDTKAIDFFFSGEDSVDNNRGAVYKLLNTVIDFYMENIKDDAMDYSSRSDLENILKGIILSVSVSPYFDNNELEEKKYEWRKTKMRIQKFNARFDFNKWKAGEAKEFMCVDITEEQIGFIEVRHENRTIRV